MLFSSIKVHEENLKEARMHRSELIHALQFQHPKEKDWKVPVLLGSRSS